MVGEIELECVRVEVLYGLLACSEGDNWKSNMQMLFRRRGGPNSFLFICLFYLLRFILSFDVLVEPFLGVHVISFFQIETFISTFNIKVVLYSQLYEIYNTIYHYEMPILNVICLFLLGKNAKIASSTISTQKLTK